MAIFSNELLTSLESLSLYPEKSSEAITDQMDKASPGGDLSSDSQPENSGETNEQNNEFSTNIDSNTSFTDDSGLGDSMSGDGDDFGGGDDSGSSDFGGGDGDVSSGDSGNTEMKLEPNESPFKAQNGKMALDDMFDSLRSTVEDSLDKIHANAAVDSVVIDQFNALLDNIDKAKETVYVLPKESTMVKYRTCVKIYNKLSNALCKQLKMES